MPISADTKDWTWVLLRACPDCGFDATAVSAPQVPGLLASHTEQWRSVLRSPDVHRRPDDATWSPLEYAAHVRDVFRLFGQRLDLMLTDDDPQFASWDQDEAALEQRYDLQDPGSVAAELAAAAQTLADTYARAAPAQHERTGRRSDGARFTVRTLGQYCCHESAHHLWDIGHD